jgi:multidrug efflux system outer membrane protein
LANYLDVLIAQRNLFDAELALSGTHRLHLVSIVQLYKALGGGWSPVNENTPAAALPVASRTLAKSPKQ